MRKLTTKEAIEYRRSVRHYKDDPISDKCIRELLESARLAPSGCNAQPWRFKIVKDKKTKKKLSEASFGQSFIQHAPVVIVCCADIDAYISGMVSGAQDLGKIGEIDDGMVNLLVGLAGEMKQIEYSQLAPHIAFNVGVAVEHIVLRALDYGLGTCWVKLLDENTIKSIFGWKEGLSVVALLTVGIPSREIQSKPRLSLEELLL